MNREPDMPSRTHVRIKCIVADAAICLAVPGVRLTLILAQLLVVLAAVSGYLAVITVLILLVPEAVYNDNRAIEFAINATVVTLSSLTAMPFVFGAQRLASQFVAGKAIAYNELFYVVSSPRAYFRSLITALLVSIRYLFPFILIAIALDLVVSPPNIAAITDEVVIWAAVLTFVLLILLIPIWLYLTRSLACLPYYLATDDQISISRAMYMSNEFVRDRCHVRLLRKLGTRVILNIFVSLLCVFLPALFHYIPLYLIAYPIGLESTQPQIKTMNK